MEERYLKGNDGHRIFLRVWPVDNPKATVHINHGMAEHSARYAQFAEYPNSFGYSVYVQDHRGHGYTKEEDEKGWFGDHDGWRIVLDDAFSIDKLISQENPYVPHILFGHSMGSFISRCTLAEHPDAFSAAIFCGTGASQGLIGRIGQKIARHNAKKNGRMPDSMMDNLAFSAYGKRFKGEGDFAWVTSDKKERKKYINDPLCGFVCSSSFYSDLIELSFRANDKNLAASIKKDIPILLISGTEDPVGDYGKGIERVRKLYLNAGIKRVEMKLFPGGRHEILNEPERQEVMKTISDFISSVIGEDDGR